MGVTDVQTIIDDFEDQVLTTNLPVWTSPSANVYVSPVDGYGKFMRLEFTRTDATRLDLVVKDQNGITLMTRRILLPANGSHVRIYTGQYHACIDVYDYSSSPEWFMAGILDLSPESQTAHSRYVYCWGSRDTADAYGQGWFKYFYMIDDVAPASYRRVNQYSGPVSGYATPNIDAMGYWVMQPALFYCKASGGTYYRYAGKAYQTLFVSRFMGDVGSTIEIPIDAGVTGKFKILSGIADTNVNYPLVMAMRITD